MDSIIALHPVAPGSILGIPEVGLFLTEINCLDLSTAALLSIKWTVQKLNNIDRTHLVLLEKNLSSKFLLIL